MKPITRAAKLLWKVATGCFLIILIGYMIVAFLLPAPKEPEPISLIGGEFGGIYDAYDGRFVGVYVMKTVSTGESDKYIQEWEKLNSGFDRKDLSVLVGFDKPLNTISRLECIVMIDCRSGKFMRFSEEYFDSKGSLIHHISSHRKQKPWFKIPKDTIIDNLAVRFCEPSAY